MAAEEEEALSEEDVVSVLKELNSKIDAQASKIAELEQNFEAFQKAGVPNDKQKFKKTEATSDWKTIAADKLKK